MSNDPNPSTTTSITVWQYWKNRLISNADLFNIASLAAVVLYTKKPPQKEALAAYSRFLDNNFHIKWHKSVLYKTILIEYKESKTAGNWNHIWKRYWSSQYLLVKMDGIDSHNFYLRKCPCQSVIVWSCLGTEHTPGGIEQHQWAQALTLVLGTQFLQQVCAVHQ